MTTQTRALLRPQETSSNKLTQRFRKTRTPRQGLVLYRQTQLGLERIAHDQMLEANVPSLWHHCYVSGFTYVATNDFEDHEKSRLQHCQVVILRLTLREIPSALSYHLLTLQSNGFLLSLLCENATCDLHMLHLFNNLP